MENKKKRLGIVVVMLVLVLAIGATAGTTLARYISSATIASETATVAKWGYTISGTTAGLFSDKYNAGAFATDDTVDVKSSSDALIVAPGTSNLGSDNEAGLVDLLTISGSAEVDAELIIDVSAFAPIVLSNNEDMEGAYYPLRWKVGESNYSRNIKTASDLAKLISKNLTLADGLESKLTISCKDETVIVKIPQGTDLGTAGIKLQISWKWDFQTLKSGSVEEGDATYYDMEDTLLGYISEGLKYSQISNLTGIHSFVGGTTAYNKYVAHSSVTVTVGVSATIQQVQNKK